MQSRRPQVEPSAAVSNDAISAVDWWRRTIGLLLGPLVALVVLILPLGNLSTDAHRLAAITMLVIIFWITEAIPLPVTALLAVTLIVASGVASAEAALSAFGSPVIFLFIGSFILAESMRLHGLDRRIAFALLAHPWVGGSTYRTIWALGLTAWLLSMWISNTASVAMLFPVALAIARSTNEIIRQSGISETIADERRYTTGLLLMVAYAGSMGGIATPIGTPPNLIGIALIEEGTNVRIRFVEWMSVGLPLAALLLAAIYGVILLCFRPAIRHVPAQQEMMRAARRELGPWTAGERNSLIAFATAITLWITPGISSLIFGSSDNVTVLLEERMPEGIVALLAATMLFILPTNWRQRTATLSWESAVRIDWGTVLLFGGGIALGRTLFETGLAESVGSGLLSAVGTSSVPALSAIGVLIASLMSETSSNTASVNIVLPVLLSAVDATDATALSALVVAVATTLGSSMGFMLPVSTPPNAIVYGSGQIRLFDMVRAGLLLDVVGILTIWLASLWFLPWVLGRFVVST